MNICPSTWVITLTTSAFSVSHDCPASLAAGAGCSLYVRFTPTTAGTVTDAIVLTTNAAGSPLHLSLTGQGLPSLVKRVDLTPVLMLLLD